MRSRAALPIKTLDHRPEPMTHAQFKEVTDDVKVAIRQGIQPKLNKAGSSGSYFVRSTSGKTVGIFKPKGTFTFRMRHCLNILIYICAQTRNHMGH